MTPKEKAIQLVSKMLEFASTNDYDYETKGAENDYHNAKKCALIVIDEMLNFQENIFITEDSLAYKYWQEVKQEIERI